MSGKQAKISLTADIAGFKRKVDELKSNLNSISKIKVSPKIAENIKLKGLAEADKQIKSLSDSAEKAGEHLKNMLKNPMPDLSGIAKVQSKIAALTGEIEKLNEIKDKVGKGDLDFNVKAPGGSALGKAAGGGIARAAGGILAGASVYGSFTREMSVADQRLAVAAPTGGAAVDEAGNKVAGRDLGYSPSEKREAAAEIANQVGRNMTSGQITKATETTEAVSRGYGVSQGAQAEFMGSVRRSGGKDETKTLASAVGAATAAGLEGSQIGQYLNAMSGYLASMSQGVNIDTTSLNGFAGALSSLPFFKSDPSRAFDAIKNLNTAFSGGDRFQQAQASRSMLMSAPGASPEALEMRRQDGLFGGTDPAMAKRLKAQGIGGDDLKVATMGGGDILQNMFKDIQESTKGLSPNEQRFQFKSRTNMKGAEGDEAWLSLREGKLNKKSIANFEKAQMSPQERLDKTFTGTNESMKTLSSTMERLKDVMADTIGPPLATIAHGFEKMFGKPEAGGVTDAPEVAGRTAAAATAAGLVGSVVGAPLALPAAVGTLLGQKAGSINDSINDNGGNDFGRKTMDMFSDLGTRWDAVMGNKDPDEASAAAGASGDSQKSSADKIVQSNNELHQGINALNKTISQKGVGGGSRQPSYNHGSVVRGK